MILHPDYKRLFNWDFCLIEVDDIPLDGTTAAVATLSPNHIGDFPTDANCAVAGWGKTEQHGQSPVVLSAEVKVRVSNGWPHTPKFNCSFYCLTTISIFDQQF